MTLPVLLPLPNTAMYFTFFFLDTSPIFLCHIPKSINTMSLLHIVFPI